MLATATPSSVPQVRGLEATATVTGVPVKVKELAPTATAIVAPTPMLTPGMMSPVRTLNEMMSSRLSEVAYFALSVWLAWVMVAPALVGTTSAIR